MAGGKPKLDTLYRDGGIDRIRRIFPDDAESSLERPLFDSIAQEPARLAGTPTKLYSLRRAKNMHPLYREPTADGGDWTFQGPWQMMGIVDFSQGDDIDTSSGGEGLKKNATATLWLARKELEDVGSPDPKIGDVIEFWDLQPYARAGKFQFWDIVKANPDGNVYQSEVFVMWKIGLESRTTFDPTRKVENTRT